MKNILLSVLLFVVASSWALASSPVGKWKTIDDNTGEARSIIKIWEEDGEIFGAIEKLFRKAHENPNPRCVKCEGDLRNKPIIGLTILENLKQDGNEWTGGTILDPENGNTYKCEIEVVENGAKLKVRGYIGISALGRTQYWIRAE